MKIMERFNFWCTLEDLFAPSVSLSLSLSLVIHIFYYSLHIVSVIHGVGTVFYDS